MKSDKPVLCSACQEPWSDHAVGGNCKRPPARDWYQAELIDHAREVPGALIHLPRGLPHAFIAELRGLGAKLTFSDGPR